MNQLELFLQVIFALCLVLAVAHMCGYLVQLVGQPKIVGEMLSGVILGPSLLGAIAPEWHAAAFGPQVKQAMFLLSQIGLAGYMFLVGCELDLGMFNGRSMRRATILSLAGIVPSMIIGGICGLTFFELLATGERAIGHWEFAFFLGSALAITAFPMLARILEENQLAATPVGTLAMLAASIDDGLAWCLLALIVAIAKSEPLTNGFLPIAGGVGFFLACFFVLRPGLAVLGRKIESCGKLCQEEFALVLILLLGAIWLTDKIGIYSVFGGFVLGLSMPRSPSLLREVRANMYNFTVVFFLPIFFANSGLNTDVGAIFSATLFIPFIVILAASFLSKYGFCTFAMRAVGFSWRDASAIGGLFNARGLMLLIFANIGITHGLINANVFSMLVIVAVITTAAAMPIFNRSIGRKPPMEDGRGSFPAVFAELEVGAVAAAAGAHAVESWSLPSTTGKDRHPSAHEI